MTQMVYTTKKEVFHIDQYSVKQWLLHTGVQIIRNVFCFSLPAKTCRWYVNVKLWSILLQI